MPRQCCHKTKERGEEEYKALVHRLNRIEGQVRGVRRMVEESAYCIDIINQVSAISSALAAFNKELLQSHIKTCVLSDVKNGNESTLDELIDTVERLIKK